MEKHVTILKKMLQTRAVAGDVSHMALKTCAEEVFLKAAKTCHDIDVCVPGIAIDRLTRKGVMDELPDIALTIMLYKGVGATGLVVLDGLMIDALIEQQTLGRVDTGKRIERPVTRIDAALCEAFIDSVLGKLMEILGTQGPGVQFVGYTRGQVEMDRPALSLALGAAEYDVFSVDLDLGPGAKTGRFQLCFPSDGSGRPVLEPGEVTEVSPAIAAAPVRLEVNLPPIQISLAELSRLTPGSTLPLSREVLNQASLSDVGGVHVLEGRLGQLDGKRAVRINDHAAEGPSPMTATAPMGSPSPTLAQDMVVDMMPMASSDSTPPQMKPAQAGKPDLPDLDMVGAGDVAMTDTNLPMAGDDAGAPINFADVDLSAFSSAD